MEWDPNEPLDSSIIRMMMIMIIIIIIITIRICELREQIVEYQPKKMHGLEISLVNN